ncbi:MAG: hypothetical protein HY868_22660 [Chloroflexi bacterium]|nr:hypothetical protein [Chloroflexota bacterium]
MSQVLDLPASLIECKWFEPRTVAVLNEPTPGDRVQSELLPKLLAAFREQQHQVVEQSSGKVNLMLAFFDVPDDARPLVERIPERPLPLSLTLMREYGLPKRPDNLVTLVTIRERMTQFSHAEAIDIARTAAARIGSPKMVFLSGNRATGELYEATYCTLEGGHPTDTRDIVNKLRDRLVSAACAHDVGGEYRIIENAIPRATWEKTRTPEALIEAGHRMAALRLLPAPKMVSDYVTPETARIYNRYLGMKGFSEGMLFAFDPETGALMVTASGSWDVDKRALKREEVVVIGGMKDGKVEVWAPEGIKPKGPSVEALEMYTLVHSVPKVRVSQNARGDWRLDPNGSVSVPIIRGGVHVHIGTERVDEQFVEDIPTNRRDFPYGFGCGTDLMKELAQDSARRSRAITDADDPRRYARWQMLYHGDTVVELWKPTTNGMPLQGLLDMYDPTKVGAIQYTPDHIYQP